MPLASHYGIFQTRWVLVISSLPSPPRTLLPAPSLYSKPLPFYFNVNPPPSASLYDLLIFFLVLVGFTRIHTSYIHPYVLYKLGYLYRKECVTLSPQVVVCGG